MRRTYPTSAEVRNEPRLGQRFGDVPRRGLVVSLAMWESGIHIVPIGRRRARQQRMEPLWSPVVATGGNQQQIGRPSKPQIEAKSVATGCHRLPEKFHGK